jgi:hypothetical protein
MDSSGRSWSCNRVLVHPDQGGQGQGWTHQGGQGDVTEYLYFLTRVDRDKDGLIREVKEM